MMISQIIKQTKKLEIMPALKLKQLKYESDTWKRMLAFMMDENIHLKNRLSEILKDGFDKTSLAEVELFQTEFIKEDEMISYLRNELVEFDKLLVREIFENGKISKHISIKLKNLRHNIKNAEKQFNRVKTTFNNYLSENFE
jgi:hypothetical protein